MSSTAAAAAPRARPVGGAIIRNCITCALSGVTKRASHGPPGGRKCVCAKHKQPGYVDYTHPKCEWVGADGAVCKNTPHFGEVGGKALRCKSHIIPGMIDVCHKRCVGCNAVQPVYGYPGGKATHCTECQLVGMCDVKNRMCVICGTAQPSYNVPGQKVALYCVECKEPGMRDVRHKMCVSCGLTRCKKKFENHCFICYVHAFPEKNVSRVYKVKEKHVADVLSDKLAGRDDIRVSYDREVGASRRRPDILIDCGAYCVVVEVDENQHETYDCECERKRMMQIFTDLRNRPLVLIRFNPDAYQGPTPSGETFSVPGCFSRDGPNGRDGVPYVRKDLQREWEFRCSVLWNTIATHLDAAPAYVSTMPEINIIPLFFDDFHVDPSRQKGKRKR